MKFRVTRTSEMFSEQEPEIIEIATLEGLVNFIKSIRINEEGFKTKAIVIVEDPDSDEPMEIEVFDTYEE